MHSILQTIALVALLAVSPACAEEALVPTAQSGSWVALEHRESMTQPVDVCVALNLTTGVAFRSDGSNVQLRIMNNSWSMPTGVTGSVVLSVANWKRAFDINDNTATMVNAELPSEAVPDMFLKIDRAAVMSVIVGKAQPINVSLLGSTRVTNAFRTCARITGNVASPGSNPFE